ncbi:MAG: class I SAM-dependent methyltransferase [Bacteroidota bacterium]
MKFLIRFADHSDPASLSSRFRRARFKLFLNLLHEMPAGPVNILDVGGTEGFWLSMGKIDREISITLLNLEKIATRQKNISTVAGDARSMPQFKDGQFDIVFSNSVIEHVGVYQDQQRMAEEIRRIGRKYFVQTPNYYFPLEPHFLFPFFHWLPFKIRVWLVQHFSLGWFERMRNREEAEKLVSGTRLMKSSELKQIFPGAEIWHERILWITKSLVAIKK